MAKKINKGNRSPKARPEERFIGKLLRSQSGWLARPNTLQMDEGQYLQKASVDILDGLPAETQRELLVSEIADMNRRSPYKLSAAHRQGIVQWNAIIGVLQNEVKAREDGLSTSFEDVELLIAKYISQCLGDFDGKKCGKKSVLKHVKLYGVVKPVAGQMPSISLHAVHLILQDNYQDSSLCRLFNLFLGASTYNSKVITFL